MMLRFSYARLVKKTIHLLPTKYATWHLWNHPNIQCQQLRHQGTVAKQIKKFYLAVHPDLFNEYPEEKHVNEQSLKLLHSYVQSIENGVPLHSTSITFYRKVEGQVGCCPVKVTLEPSTRHRLYIQILNAFNVPYEDTGDAKESSADSHFDMPTLEKMDLGNFQKKIVIPTLNEWLTENLSSAKLAQEASEFMRRCTSETFDRLKKELGIRQVVHNFKFTFSSLNNLLCLFEKVLTSEMETRKLLKNRTILLGNFTGLDHAGRFVLDFFDRPEIWRQGLRELPYALMAFDCLQETREQLKTECFGLNFTPARFLQPTPIVPYYKSLNFMLENLQSDEYLCDFQCKGVNALPEWDGGLISVSREGYVQVPLDVSKKALHSYLQRNHDRIKNKRRKHLKKVHHELKYLHDTKSQLKLSTLLKDPILKTEEVESACEKILKSNNLDGLEGCDVIISNYYSVSADGFIRIPWNFLE